MTDVSPPFPSTFRPRVYPDLIVDRTGEMVILLHPVETSWAMVNESGLEMAALLDGSRTVAEAAALLAGEYGIDAAPIEADLLTFVNHLYESNLLENAPLAEDRKPAPKPSRPPSLTIYVTEQCNLRCKHCAIVEGKMPETLLSYDDIIRMIDDHTSRHSNPTVAFLGGEPLLRPDAVAMIAHACQRSNAVNLGTNGLFVDDAMAAKLAALPVNVQVSLDGADPEVHDFIRGKGTFEKTWAAIERLAKAGGAARLTIASSLTQCLFPQVRELVRRCDELGIGKIRFLPLNRTKAALTNWDRIAPDPAEMMAITRWMLFDAASRPGAVTQVMGGFPGYVPNADTRAGHWCPLGQTMIVDSQGEVYTCPSLTVPEVTIGNVRQEGLDAVADGDRIRAARAMMLERRFKVPECRACAWRNFCQGGCAAFMSHRSGSLFINDEFCEFRRELYRENALRKAARVGG